MTLIPMKIMFPKLLKRTQPGQMKPVTTHSLRTQHHDCGSTLVLKTTTKTYSAVKIIDIDDDIPEFENLYNTLHNSIEALKCRTNFQSSVGELQKTWKKISVNSHDETKLIQKSANPNLLETHGDPETFIFHVKFIFCSPQETTKSTTNATHNTL